MRPRLLFRQAILGLKVGLGLLLCIDSNATSVWGQNYPAFPENGSISGSTGNDRSEASQARWVGSGPSPDSLPSLQHASRAEHGFRSVDDSNKPIPTQTHPAVISSSYHKAVVNNTSESSSGLPGHPSASIPAGNSVGDQLSAPTLRQSTDTSMKRTPLTPPGASNKEVKSQSGSSLQMLLSVGSSLMMVIGLFLGSVWLYRKSVGSSKAGGLPKNVVQILGRTPVATRQQLVLLRFGSKLVLVSMVQGETRAISEISDPVEVDRLAGLCEGSQPGSISSSFREILTHGGRL